MAALVAAAVVAVVVRAVVVVVVVAVVAVAPLVNLWLFRLVNVVALPPAVALAARAVAVAAVVNSPRS